MEDREPELLEIIESYNSHSDYNRLKKEFTDYAKKLRRDYSDSSAAVAVPEIFTSMQMAIDSFVNDGSFTGQDGSFLLDLLE